MATVFLVLVVVLVVAALVFGVISLLSGDDPGLSTSEPDGRARPLPNNRSLTESDLNEVRFDVSLRGYRMAEVDRVLRRTAYDLGYKDEMIAVLEAEVAALREGRREDAELLRKARESAAGPAPTQTAAPIPAVEEWSPAESDFAKNEPDSEESAEGAEPDNDPNAYDPASPGRLAPRSAVVPEDPSPDPASADPSADPSPDPSADPSPDPSADPAASADPSADPTSETSETSSENSAASSPESSGGASVQGHVERSARA